MFGPLGALAPLAAPAPGVCRLNRPRLSMHRPVHAVRSLGARRFPELCENGLEEEERLFSPR